MNIDLNEIKFGYFRLPNTFERYKSINNRFKSFRLTWKDETLTLFIFSAKLCFHFSVQILHFISNFDWREIFVKLWLKFSAWLCECHRIRKWILRYFNHWFDRFCIEFVRFCERHAFVKNISWNQLAYWFFVVKLISRNFYQMTWNSHNTLWKIFREINWHDMMSFLKRLISRNFIKEIS